MFRLRAGLKTSKMWELPRKLDNNKPIRRPMIVKGERTFHFMKNSK
ncbi:hypothetical protein LEP1GSC123_4390 [Leptospira borgpetersenii str. 200701203]|uniref:Uncharacterized protein n=1 Tax=Leptospira borgpetersenii str. 200701203 TaxID=1193007 RepID=M3FJS8_LEPBO|nr:hypothetical protein LEP1GSC123_4390 [Leptospira borgpetersenii str. 200701203]